MHSLFLHWANIAAKHGCARKRTWQLLEKNPAQEESNHVIMHTHVAWVKIKLHSSPAAPLSPASVHHKIWQTFSQEARRGATDFTPFPNQDVWRLWRGAAPLCNTPQLSHRSQNLSHAGGFGILLDGSVGAEGARPHPHRHTHTGSVRSAPAPGNVTHLLSRHFYCSLFC